MLHKNTIAPGQWPGSRRGDGWEDSVKRKYLWKLQTSSLAGDFRFFFEMYKFSTHLKRKSGKNRGMLALDGQGVSEGKRARMSE